MKISKPQFVSNKKKTFRLAASVSGFIHQIGENPQLREPSEKVDIKKITSLLMQQKIDYAKKCLLLYTKKTGHGRGIAGVQIGFPQRFFVAYSTKDRKGITVFINPVVTKKSETLLKYPEICMSANPIIAPVVRPSWIEFSYYDENGKKNYWKTKDDTEWNKMLNRIFQHEIDHMDGIINIDLVDSRELILESDPDFYKNAKFETV